MRNRSSSTEHAEAVSRRLATLSAELAAVRGDPREEAPVHASAVGPPPDVGPAADAVPAIIPGPATIPVPGRHARRRLPARGGTGPLRLAPAHLVVLVLVLAVGLAVTAWFVVRSAAEPAALPRLEPAGGPLLTASAEEGSPAAGDAAGAVADGPPGADPSPAAEEVTVDVAGKVRRPGIAVLPAGSRVVDAIEAAGGARSGVDLTSLNLARLLVDGEQVLVGLAIPAAAGAVGAVPAPGGSGSDGPLVDLNTADQATLETLPGVGPVTATAIIDWRTEHGGFSSVDELLEVDGIGEATLDELAPHVTI